MIMTDNPLNQPLNSSGGHNIKYNYEKNHIDKPVVLVFPVSEDSSTLSGIICLLFSSDPTV